MLRMQEDYKSYEEKVKEIFEKVKQVRKEDQERHNKDEERRLMLFDMLDKRFPGWEKHYMQLLGFTGPGPLTKEAREKIKEFGEKLRALPEDDDYPDD